MKVKNNSNNKTTKKKTKQVERKKPTKERKEKRGEKLGKEEKEFTTVSSLPNDGGRRSDFKNNLIVRR